MNETMKNTFACIGLIASVAVAAPAYAEDQQTTILQLQQQIDALTQRVEALEQQKTQPTAALPAQAPVVDSPWQHLRVGLRDWKVEKLLGKPVSKKKGSVEYWYYSEDHDNGPMVKFVLKAVHSWRAPQE